jgi:hypothetical protein
MSGFTFMAKVGEEGNRLMAFVFVILSCVAGDDDLHA